VDTWEFIPILIITKRWTWSGEYVLIYLNKDWKNEYGGQLELWDEKMTEPVQTVIPTFNRCVIFNTTSNSNHGNPNPVNHPTGMSRKSIALYYYTATWTEEKKEHTTRFQARPGSRDGFDWSNRIKELARDYVPPILARKVLSRKS
jgi:2OG-Fe(II) oxygenase superfamily